MSRTPFPALWLAALALLSGACATYTPVRTHFNKGVRLYGEENYSGAAREYRLAIEEDPMDYRAHFNLAMALEQQGRTDLARAEYEWILSVRPDDLRSSVNLAALEIESGEREAGYARLEGVAARYTTLAMPRVALATHYLREDRLDEAERLARQAVRLDDSDIEGNYILGAILLRKADQVGAGSPEGTALLDDARVRLRRALANAPGDVASLLALGRLEMAAGKPTLARSYYRRVVMERRTSLEAHRALAELSERDGDLEQAVEHLWEVRRLDRKAEDRVSADLVRLYGELLREEQARPPATTESAPTTQP